MSGVYGTVRRSLKGVRFRTNSSFGTHARDVRKRRHRNQLLLESNELFLESGKNTDKSDAQGRKANRHGASVLVKPADRVRLRKILDATLTMTS